MLTPRQQSIFEFILEFRRRCGCSPSIPEIQKAFLIRSPNGVVGHLLALEAKGLIRRAERGSRQIDIVNPDDMPHASLVSLPLFTAGDAHTVAAEKFVTLDESTLGFQSAPGAFALRASDDSMSAAGIATGDIVILQPPAEPESGQIIATDIGGALVLRRLLCVGETWSLRMENGGQPAQRPYSPESTRGIARLVVHRLS